MSHHSLLVLCLAVLAVVGQGSQELVDHCYPGSSCFPKIQQWYDFMGSLDGDAISAYDGLYYNLTLMINTRVTRFPYFVIAAESIDDVVKTVNFATKFNLKLTIRSSGHDYIGRSTSDGSLQLNLSRMKKLTFDLDATNRNPAGELKAESGNTWIRVYEEANKRGRSIVGGSAHTVSMGGYTLGGGHAPICRKFGLAVDNLLEVEMVIANGSIVYANANGTTTVDPETGNRYVSPDTDLFWAVRGGGGSTFGIVTTFTYKLHFDSKMVKLSCSMNMYDSSGHDTGSPFLKAFNDILGTSLAPEWGGYQMYSSYDEPTSHGHGIILLYLNHFGEWGTASFHTIDAFVSKFPNRCLFENKTSFLDYEKNSKDALYFQNYIFNVFMQPDSFTDEFYHSVFEMVVNNSSMGGADCTGTLIGGNMKNMAADDTAVNPSFRTGVQSLTCGISWTETEEDKHVAYAEQLTANLLRFGKGTYFNEPSAYLPDWKMAYWGGHYDKLLRIKEKWDPNNVFTCHHCVGSDDLKPSQSTVGIPGIIG